MEELQTTVTEPIAEPTQSPFLRVKFNHEDKDLDETSAREYAQKGMNYDKVHSELEKIKTEYEGVKNEHSQFKSVAEIVKAEGYENLEDYISVLKSEKLEEVPTLDGLTKFYEDKGNDRDTAETLAQLRIDNIKARNNERIQKGKHAQNEMFSKRKANDLQKVSEKFPDYKNGLPQEFTEKYGEELNAGNIGFFEAVYDFEHSKLKSENDDLKAKLSAYETNNANKSKSVGGVKADADTDFFTEEQVNEMTSKEIAKNYDKIMKSMKKWSDK